MDINNLKEKFQSFERLFNRRPNGSLILKYKHWFITIKENQSNDNFGVFYNGDNVEWCEDEKDAICFVFDLIGGTNYDTI